jgi:hypothetical protein
MDWQWNRIASPEITCSLQPTGSDKGTKNTQWEGEKDGLSSVNVVGSIPTQKSETCPSFILHHFFNLKLL